jgi:hypothetical protein
MVPEAADRNGTPARYRQLRLCSGGGGFEAVPSRPQRVDLARTRRDLERAGVPVVDAGVLLIVTLEVEVTVSRGGRLLFKTRNEHEASSAFGRILPFVDPAA